MDEEFFLSNIGEYDDKKDKNQEDGCQDDISVHACENNFGNRYESFSKKIYTLCKACNGVRFLGKFLLDESNHSGSPNTFLCQISLTTDSLLDLDNECFSDLGKGETLEKYHPYLIELLTSLSKEEVASIRKILYMDEWLEITIYNRKPQKKAFHGSFVFGASPLCRRRKYFVVDCVSPKMQDKLKNLGTVVDFSKNLMDKYKIPKSMITRFTDMVSATESFEGHIYNVGQGNCIKFDLNTNTKIETLFFDVGMSVFEPIKIIKNHLDCKSFIEENFVEIRKACPSWIILSHWDIDHILGLSELDSPKKTIYDSANWIVPNLCQLGRNVSLSAARIFCYILTKHNVVVVNSVSNGGGESIIPIQKNKKINLLLGVGQGNNGNSTMANNIGIILGIESILDKENKSRYLFPGDCEYSMIPMFLKEGKYDLLMASHHGSSRSLPCDIEAAARGWAVISVGKNPYGHPQQEHVDALMNKGFDVYSVYGWHEVKFGIDNKGEIYKRMI